MALVFKVFTLTMKTLSKPLAGQFERYVMGHPVLRDKVIAIAQRIHKMDVRITRGAEGRTGRAFVGDMSEEKAVQLASKVASEGFVYSFAVILLLLEMDRKATEDAVKKEKTTSETARIDQLHERHLQAEADLKKNQNDMEELLNRMDERMLMIEEQILDMRKHNEQQAEQRQRILGIF